MDCAERSRFLWLLDREHCADDYGGIRTPGFIQFEIRFGRPAERGPTPGCSCSGGGSGMLGFWHHTGDACPYREEEIDRLERFIADPEQLRRLRPITLREPPEVVAV